MSERKVARSIELFYSYAHSDERLHKRLEAHLSVLRQQGVITEWHDRKIVAGADWKQSIDTHLMTATIILLLISPDFLASDYCYGVEMQKALARHAAGDACVIPVILRPVDWQGSPFAHLQCLPKDAKPVTTWKNRDEAFRNVATAIRAAIEQLHPHQTPLDTAQENAPVLSYGSKDQIFEEKKIVSPRHGIYTYENLPNGFVPIYLGHGTTAAFKVEAYESLETLLDDMFLYYLSDRFSPYTYGKAWSLREDAHMRGRYLLPWSSLQKENIGHPASIYDPTRAQFPPITYGLVEGSGWNIDNEKPTPFGLATNNELLAQDLTSLRVLPSRYRKQFMYLYQIVASSVLSIHRGFYKSDEGVMYVVSPENKDTANYKYQIVLWSRLESLVGKVFIYDGPWPFSKALPFLYGAVPDKREFKIFPDYEP